MKKLAVTIFFLAFLVGVNAQDKKPENRRDYVVMKEGKMMVVKEGKTSPMEKEMTLGDGTRVMADGKVMMKDGTTKILKEGESLPISGSSRKKDPA